MEYSETPFSSSSSTLWSSGHRCLVAIRYWLQKLVRKKESPSPTLPPDIFFEILTRATFKDIVRCRLVSKDWNSITYESSFMQAHSERTKTITGFFLQSYYASKPIHEFVPGSDQFPELSLKFLPGPIKAEACTKQGIFLCVNNYTTKIPLYYVCKPSTKQWQKIPNPKTRFFTQRCGMLVARSNPLHYKIVRFSKPKQACIMHNSVLYDSLYCEIFYSKTWAWKKLEKLVLLPHLVFLGFQPAVSACGSLHWLLTDHTVFAFHGDTESWTIFDIPFPLCSTKYFDHMKLVEYKGQLGMICVPTNGHIQLWVMEDYSTKIWSKRNTALDIETLVRMGCNSCPGTIFSSDILLMTGFYRVIYYNFDRCKSKVCKLRFDNLSAIYPFQSDFEPVNLKG
ncbi:F-box protein At5g49610-like [Fagus crenata]